MKNMLTSATVLVLLSSTILPTQAASTDSAALSETLAECLHQNASADDKQTLVKWAYVALSKTSAGKAVQTIPDTKVKAVESSAQKTLTNLVVGRCSAPAMKVLLKNPKKGLQDTLSILAGKLINAEIERRTSPLLSLTLTDLIGSAKK